MLNEFCDFRRGKCEMQCGFGILRVESAKAVQNLGIFRGKCEMLTEPGIFCGENAKCRAGISIFCAERTKIRSGFAILSLAAAKIALPCVPNRCAISGIRRRGGYIYVSANFRDRNRLIRTSLSIASGFVKSDAAECSVLWATIYYLRNQVLGPACGR